MTLTLTDLRGTLRETRETLDAMTCETCGDRFERTKRSRRFCSVRCKETARKRRYRANLREPHPETLELSEGERP